MDRDLPTLLRDLIAAAAIAAPWAAVVWILPFGGMPIVALFAAPIGLVALGGFAWAPVLIGSFRQPLPHAVGGAVLLLAAGHLTALGTIPLLEATHGVALGWSRGTSSWLGAAAALGPWIAWLVIPWALFSAGLRLARGLRIGAAVVVAGLLVALPPATANVLFLYAALGMPLTA